MNSVKKEAVDDVVPAKQPQAADSFDDIAPLAGQFYPDASRTNLEFRFSRKLIQTARRWINLIDGTLKNATGQNRARWQTLFAIAFAEPPITTNTISEHRNVRWPTLVRTLTALEKDGLISRRDNPEDGRSRLIELTPAGRGMLRRMQPLMDCTRSSVLEDLDDEDLKRMTVLLDLVFERIAAVTPESLQGSDIDD